jgi:hypothetical protein
MLDFRIYSAAPGFRLNLESEAMSAFCKWNIWKGQFRRMLVVLRFDSKFVWLLSEQFLRLCERMFSPVFCL